MIEYILLSLLIGSFAFLIYELYKFRKELNPKHVIVPEFEQDEDEIKGVEFHKLEGDVTKLREELENQEKIIKKLLEKMDKSKRT